MVPSIQLLVPFFTGRILGRSLTKVTILAVSRFPEHPKMLCSTFVVFLVEAS